LDVCVRAFCVSRARAKKKNNSSNGKKIKNRSKK